jgi:hypothetical protein
VATCILIFQKAGKADDVWFYRVDNDGFSDGANRFEVKGSDLPSLLELWRRRLTREYRPQETKHRFVSIAEIRRSCYDLCHRVYLSGYRYPEGVKTERLGDLFELVRGGTPAASASDDGEYPFVTTSAEIKRADDWQIDCKAIVIPVVSSTGHGHASIKQIHYLEGKAAIATICVTLVPKREDVDVEFIYYYLRRFKDQLLVPLMRGSANVSLNPDRLADLMLPIPSPSERKSFLAGLRDLSDEVAALDAALKKKLDELDAARDSFGGKRLGFVAR